MKKKQVEKISEWEKHFQSPKNARRMENATHFSKVSHPVCDDQLEIYFRVADGKVCDASFLAKACSATMVLASMSTEKVQGKKVEEIISWNPDFVRSWAGVALPAQKAHAAEIVCRALQEALRK